MPWLPAEAAAWAKKGIHVLLTYHCQSAEAQATVREIGALGQKAAALQLDSTDVKSVDAFFERVTEALQGAFGANRFDFLINNAGTSLRAPLAELTEAQFDQMVNIHLKGVYFLTRKALSFLNDGGRIINISTAVTRYAYPGSSVYGITKGAVEVFTRYLALELGPRGIAANVVAPGAVFGGGTMADLDTPETRTYVAGSGLRFVLG